MKNSRWFNAAGLKGHGSMKYMVERDGGVVGPYDLDQLKERLESNYFSLSNLVCEDQGGRWMPLSELFRVKPEVEKAAKPPSLLDRLRSVVTGPLKK
jgi:GYF domain 2